MATTNGLPRFVEVLRGLPDDVRKLELSRAHAEYSAHLQSWQILLDAFEANGGFLDGSYLWPYARDRKLTIVREFVDVETARRAGRTEFREMLAFVESSPSCRTILVEKTDRLYRNIRD